MSDSSGFCRLVKAYLTKLGGCLHTSLELVKRSIVMFQIDTFVAATATG